MDRASKQELNERNVLGSVWNNSNGSSSQSSSILSLHWHCRYLRTFKSSHGQDERYKKNNAKKVASMLSTVGMNKKKKRSERIFTLWTKHTPKRYRNCRFATTTNIYLSTWKMKMFYMRLKCARYVFNSCYHRQSNVRYWLYQFARWVYSGIRNSQMLERQERRKRNKTVHLSCGSRLFCITTIIQWYLEHFVYSRQHVNSSIFINDHTTFIIHSVLLYAQLRHSPRQLVDTNW